MKKLLIVFLIACGCCASNAAGQVSAGWTNDQSIRSGDIDRYFRYYIPAQLPDQRPPMVIFLHGGGGSMRDAMPPSGNGSAHWPAVAEENGFVLMVPNGYNAESADAFGDDQNWNDCRVAPGPALSLEDDTAFIASLIDWAAEHLAVDTTRVYVSGSSNGGMMAMRLADEAPNRFAAVATFIANQPDESECSPVNAPLPMMIVVGTEDPLMPFAGGFVANSRGTVVSAEATRDLWLERNRLTGVSPELASFPDIDPNDGSTVVVERYVEGPLELSYLEMVGAGHAMPSIVRRISPLIEVGLTGPQNHDIEGAAEAWRFFSRFQAAPPENAHSLSGLWFEPDLPGDGFNLVADSDNSVLYFYGYNNAGELLWLISEPFSGSLAPGASIDVEMFLASGGTFQSPADPSGTLVSWGRLRWQIRSCQRIDSTLISHDGDQKDGQLVKLLGVSNASC